MQFIRTIGAIAVTALLALPSAAQEAPAAKPALVTKPASAASGYGLPGARFTVAFPTAPTEEKSEAGDGRPASVSYRASTKPNLFFVSVIDSKATPAEEPALLDSSVAALTVPPSGFPLEGKTIADITIDGVKGKRITGSTAKLRYVGHLFVHKGRIFIVHGVSRPPTDAAFSKIADDFVKSFRILDK